MQEIAPRENQTTFSDNKLQPFQITVIFLFNTVTMFRDGLEVRSTRSCRAGKEIKFHIFEPQTCFILLAS
jgi:hypothetical protein